MTTSNYIPNASNAFLNLRRVFHPSILFSSFISSLILAIVTIVVGISCASLIFRGELQEYLGLGIVISVISAIIINLTVAIFGSDQATVGAPQSAPVLIQAVLVGSYVENAPAMMTAQEVFTSAVAIILVSAFLTGLALMLLSVGRTGNLFRFVPYPVMGGFLAGSGYLLLQDSFTTMADLPLDRYNFDRLIDGAMVLRWLPGLAFGLGMLWIMRRTGNFIMLPLSIVGGTALFYAILFLGNATVSEAAVNGWLAPAISTDISSDSFRISGLVETLQVVDFSSLIFTQAGTIATLAVIVLLNVLINLTGQEMIVGREINLNRELATAGAGNMLSSLFGGGVISFPCLACAALVHKVRAHGRLVCIMVSVMMIYILWQGSDVLSLFPRAIIGGLLAYLGFDFMTTWLYDTWGRMSRKDYSIIVLMTFIISYSGFIAGIASGIVLSIALFVVEYARIGAVQDEMLGSEYAGVTSLKAKGSHMRLLEQQVWILRLQGMLFFGTSHQLHQRVKSRLEHLEADRDPLKYIIFDFQLVKGIDISTVMDFTKVRALTDHYGIHILLSNVPSNVRQLLVESSFAVKDPNSDEADTFYDLDHAMQWCEHKLLEEAGNADEESESSNRSLKKFLEDRDFSFETIEPYLERLEVGVGEIIAYRDEPSDSLFFIESGRVNIELHEPDRIVHMRSFGSGAIVGEMGFYLRQRRSARIVSAQAGVFYVLTREALSRMEKEAPAAAAAFHSFTSALLSERLTVSNRMVQALTA